MNRLAHYPHPLPLCEDDFIAWRRWSREFRPDYTAELDALAGRGVRIAVPLYAKNDLVGVVLLGAPEGRERYTLAERQLLSGMASVFALMIENARLTDRAVEQDRLRRDLALAAEVQRRLLPPHPPANAVATLAAFTMPARIVGGDYYDFVDMDDDRLGIVVADVSGKGVAAALLMSVVQTALRVISIETNLTLGELTARMNRVLYQSTSAEKYATFFYAQLDRRALRLRYINAGHNPPYLVRCDNGHSEVIELSTGGTVLGLFPESEYQEGEVQLRPGDLFVAFTDGVPEARNVAGEEFGEERLKSVLQNAAGAAAPEVSSQLSKTVREWIGGAEQHDDLTFVIATIH
jgi:sigma-B regulation protein RsbU (phosphoserine phosphatase)